MVGFIRFTASWCAPCHSYGPVVQSVVDELGVNYEVIDLDQNYEEAIKLGVQGLPVVLAIKGNDVVGRLLGSNNKDKVKEFILANNDN